MSMNCPRCGSPRITKQEPGKRLGSRIGALTGAAVAVASATRGACCGAALGPAGAVVGGVSGVLLTALFGGSAGGAIGGALGMVADQNFLPGRRCVDCGSAFRSGDDGLEGPLRTVHPSSAEGNGLYAGDYQRAYE